MAKPCSQGRLEPRVPPVGGVVARGGGGEQVQVGRSQVSIARPTTQSWVQIPGQEAIGFRDTQSWHPRLPGWSPACGTGLRCLLLRLLGIWTSHTQAGGSRNLMGRQVRGGGPRRVGWVPCSLAKASGPDRPGGGCTFGGAYAGLSGQALWMLGRKAPASQTQPPTWLWGPDCPGLDGESTPSREDRLPKVLPPVPAFSPFPSPCCAGSGG